MTKKLPELMKHVGFKNQVKKEKKSTIEHIWVEHICGKPKRECLKAAKENR